MIKLSIIIPYYNTKTYTDELLSQLDKQITNEVEVILIDDGSKEEYKSNYEWIKIIRKENGGVSSARNVGLEIASGEYIAFIDSDDLVSADYIKTILNKIEIGFDDCYLSWKTIGGWNYSKVLTSKNDKFDPWNLCCWNRIYKKECIGDLKFNIKKLVAEDAEFIREVEKKCNNHDYIDKILYTYRSDTPNSLTKRFNCGDLNTKRTVIHYEHITSDMVDLIDKVKQLDKEGEVIILTNNNEIPKLEEYAMVMNPRPIRGTDFIGEPTKLFTKIYLPIKTRVVIYTANTFAIGGIESFTYYLALGLKDKYDVTVAYASMHNNQLNRLNRIVRTVNINDKVSIECDTLIMNRITDYIPDNIKYNKLVQMIHSCKILKEWHLPKRDAIFVPVSEAVRKSFAEELKDKEVKVINNLCKVKEVKRQVNENDDVLKLVSFTRMSFEKGKDRIIELARQLHMKKIPFIWLVFTNEKLDSFEGLIQVNPTLNVSKYISHADYLVQLSDSEAWCYSLVESLKLGTPVITTPLEVLPEIGVKDGVNGFVVPFDMKNIDLDKIYNSKLQFDYKDNENDVVNQWSEILGDVVPFDKYNCKEEYIMKIKMLKNVLLAQENIQAQKDNEYDVTLERAKQICEAGYAVMVEEIPTEEVKAVKEVVVEEAVAPEEKEEVAKVKRTVTRRKK